MWPLASITVLFIIKVHFTEGQHGQGQATTGDFYPNVNIPEKNSKTQKKKKELKKTTPHFCTSIFSEVSVFLHQI